MYYLNSRYYNPEIGRFINADGLVGPVGGILTHNMYAYAINNPVMMIDPNGYSPWSWLEDRWNDTKEWVTGVYDDVNNWLDSTYESPFTIPSLSEEIIPILSSLVGINITGGQVIHKIEGIEAINTVISSVTISSDILNTWTENNNNTIRQRFQKTGIQLLGFGANVGVGIVVGLSFSAAVASGGTLLPVALAVTGVCLGMWAPYKIEEYQRKLYHKYGIE